MILSVAGGELDDLGHVARKFVARKQARPCQGQDGHYRQ